MEDFKKAFLDKIIPLALADEKSSRVPAEVTVGQAILESNWGRSKLTILGNNLFGIKSTPIWKGKVLYIRGWEIEHGKRQEYMMEWRAYDTWEESIADHGTFLSKPRYKDAFKFDDWKDFLHAIADAGYATDPTYAAKIIQIVRKYDIVNRLRPVAMEKPKSLAARIKEYFKKGEV